MKFADYALAARSRKHIAAALAEAEAEATTELVVNLEHYGIQVDSEQLASEQWVARWTRMSADGALWPSRQRSALQHYIVIMLSNWERRQRKR